MPIPLDPLPPGLEGQGYAAGATNLRSGYPIMVPPPPVVGALRPDMQVMPNFSPMDLVSRARDRFLNLFRPTAPPVAAVPLQRTAALESGLNDLERRSTSVKDLRLANAIANANR